MGSQRVRHDWLSLHFMAPQTIIKEQRSLIIGHHSKYDNDEKVWSISGITKYQASLVAQLVKNLPAMQETLVWFLGGEDPLEKETATTPVFWPGEFQGLYSPCGSKETDTNEWLSQMQQRHEGNRCSWENGADYLLDAELSPTLNLWKKKKGNICKVQSKKHCLCFSLCRKCMDSFFKYYWCRVDLQCCAISAVQQSDSVINTYIYFFISFSIMVFHKILNIVPHAVR